MRKSGEKENRKLEGGDNVEKEEKLKVWNKKKWKK